MSRFHRKLSGPRWERARRAAFERDSWRCRDCGGAGGLQAHHLRPVAAAPRASLRAGQPPDPMPELPYRAPPQAGAPGGSGVAAVPRLTIAGSVPMKRTAASLVSADVALRRAGGAFRWRGAAGAELGPARPPRSGVPGLDPPGRPKRRARLRRAGGRSGRPCRVDRLACPRVLAGRGLDRVDGGGRRGPGNPLQCRNLDERRPWRARRSWRRWRSRSARPGIPC